MLPEDLRPRAGNRTMWLLKQQVASVYFPCAFVLGSREENVLWIPWEPIKSLNNEQRSKSAIEKPESQGYRQPAKI